MRGRLPTKFWSTAIGCFLLAPPLLASELFFETDVRPILKAACFQCHGEEEEKEGKLDVRLVRLLAAGGKSGPVLKPGDPEGSLLWEKLVADEMPKGQKMAFINAGPKGLSSSSKKTKKKITIPVV